jgi:hypothetical protein
MGDAADDYTDQGFDQLDAHRRGECEDQCPYCDDDGPMACPACGSQQDVAAWVDDGKCDHCGAALKLPGDDS